MGPTKRFIAGAVCPKCGALDRLKAYTDESNMYRECVSCGFHEKQLVQVEADELDTRVNQLFEHADNDTAGVQVVNMNKLKPKT